VEKEKIVISWRRCPKSSFYRRPGYAQRVDKRAAALDSAYVDPVDFILVHTIPGDDGVHVIKWRVIDPDPRAFAELEPLEKEIILAWSERIQDEMAGEISWERKENLLGDLDVDYVERDMLLGVVERFAFLSPLDSTAVVQAKVPKNPKAVSGILFHYGVGPC
jgi:hypothetical protein